MLAERGVTAWGGDELLDQGVDRLGEHDGLAPEPEACLGVARLDVFERELADRCGCLRVEHDEQSGDAVFAFESVIVQQPAALVPAGLGVDDAGRSAPFDRRELQCCQLLPAGPPDEVPGVGPRGRVRVGQPRVEVALPGGGEGQVPGGEPVEQRGGRGDVAPSGDDLTVGGAVAADSVAQPGQHVPEGVAVQQLPFVGVLAFGDADHDPALEADEVLIARRQRAGGHQDSAQVLRRFAVRQFVQGGVGERPLTRPELAQDHRRVFAAPALPARALQRGRAAACVAGLFRAYRHWSWPPLGRLQIENHPMIKTSEHPRRTAPNGCGYPVRARG